MYCAVLKNNSEINNTSANRLENPPGLEATLKSLTIEAGTKQYCLGLGVGVLDIIVCRQSLENNRKLKKLPRLLQRKRHIQIELCFRLSILWLSSLLVTLYKICEEQFLLLGTSDCHHG